MNYCNMYLIICSLIWSLSPFFYKKAGIYYNNNDYSNMIRYATVGFILGGLGTFIFIKATSLCNDLSKAVAFTYALPIIFTTLVGIIIFKHTISISKIIGLFLIISGLYLL